jgi:hypothetical protein
MTDRRWILTAALATFVVFAINAAIMITFDVYGLFRNPNSRRLPIFYGDRMGKYLLSSRYVPANFDALLIGPSSSVNWDPDLIAQGAGLRIYNESLEGGDSTEEKILVDQAVAHGRYRLALVVLFPTMIGSHNIEEGLEKTTRAEALASINSYVQTVLTVLTHYRVPFSHGQAYPNGSHEKIYPHHIHTEEKINFQIDPIALRNLQDLLAELRSHSIRVIYVVPPLYQALLNTNQLDCSAYYQSLRPLLPESAWIDLNATGYTAFRSDTRNYYDGFHLVPDAARQVSRFINQRLLQLMALAPQQP